MIFSKLLRNLAIGAALAAAPAASLGQVVLQVGIAPPALPVYAQPVIPGDGYIWTPGYWAYGPEGYYWVPGVWVEPPTVGFLWTPAYWGWEGGFYRFHEGYWGPHIGFYGGINYGFGYFGHGFEGGYWTGNHFFYNRAYGNFGGVRITNVYNHPVNVAVYNHVSFNGGRGGIQERPQPAEMQAMHEQHVGPTANQASFHNAAAANPAQRFSANGGHPGTMAASTTRAGFGNSNAGRGGNAPGGAAAARPGNTAVGARPGNAPGAAPAMRSAAPQSTTHVAPPPRPAAGPVAAPAARSAPAFHPAPAARSAPAPAAHSAPARSAPARGNPRR